MAKGSAAEMLFTGSDARLKAVRNNLVRKAVENVENVSKLTKVEVLALVAFQNPSEYASAGKALTDAINARAKEVGLTPAEVSEAAGAKK